MTWKWYEHKGSTPDAAECIVDVLSRIIQLIQQIWIGSDFDVILELFKHSMCICRLKKIEISYCIRIWRIWRNKIDIEQFIYQDS